VDLQNSNRLGVERDGTAEYGRETIALCSPPDMLWVRSKPNRENIEARGFAHALEKLGFCREGREEQRKTYLAGARGTTSTGV